MTRDRRRRPPTIQLEFPLGSSAAPGAPRAARGTPRDDRGIPRDEEDWRLDERTRHIGRQGVAAARALLAAGAEGLDGTGGDHHVGGAGGYPGDTGRAA